MKPLTPWQERREAARFDEVVEAMLRGDSSDATDPSLRAAGTLLQARERLEREVVPAADAAAALRIRLVAEAERLAADGRTSLAGAPITAPAAQLALSNPGVRRPRRLTALVAGAVLACTGATAAVASQAALPGEALYPVKLGLERLALVGDDPAEAGRERLEQATTRLDETAALAARGDDALAADALADFVAGATEGGSALLAADVDGESGAAEDVRAFTQQATVRIDALSRTADSDLFTALVTAANTVFALDSQVDSICPTCAGRAAPLASFARAADEASRVLDGLSGVEVGVADSAREAVERVARETPQRERTQERQRSQREPSTTRREGRQPSAPAQQDPTAPQPRVPAVPRVPTSDVPVVGSTLDEVQDVVEEQVVRELEEQVGPLTEDLLGDTLGGLLP